MSGSVTSARAANDGTGHSRWLGTVGLTALVGCSLGLPSTPDTLDGGGTVFSSDAGALGDGAGPLVCPPVTTGFRPTQEWHPPNAARRNLCTEMQITQLAECLSAFDNNPASCDAFKAQAMNTTCVQCAISSSISPNYGPMIDDGQWIYPNTAGCVSLLSGDSSARSCGAVVLANEECASYACKGCGDAREFGPNFEACFATAVEVDCGGAYNRKCAEGLESQCFGQSYREDIFKVIKLFCGT